MRYCDECPVQDCCQGIALRLVRDKTRCEQRCVTFDEEATLARPPRSILPDVPLLNRLLELHQRWLLENRKLSAARP